jgi:uncharacterized protein
VRAGAALLAALALAAAAAAPAAAKEVPYLSGRVVDEAGMIPPDVAQRIETELEALERDTGIQVAVLTVPSLEGEVLEDYSLRVAETWALGRQGEDDGALLLVARDDRKMRIEVGYGLEGRLTDLQSGRILDDVMRPKFRSGDFGGGIEAGVDALAGTLRGDPEAIPEPSPVPTFERPPVGASILGMLIFAVVIGTFSRAALSAPGCSGWFLYLFLVPFYLIFPSALVHPFAGIGLGGAWLIGFPLLHTWLTRSSGGKKFAKRHSGWFPVGGGGWSSGGGGGWSSGGGGGFSGGGGSFGGGGASSSW